MNLKPFWLRDRCPAGADALASTEMLAASIVENLQAALELFMKIAEDVGGK